MTFGPTTTATDSPALERRGFAPLEIRSDGGGALTLTGYACVTGVWYDVGSYQECVTPGAFAETLREGPDVQLLINHTGLSLARTIAGTLRLTEDSHGLKVEADLDREDPDSQTLARKLKRRDLDQMSFAFQVFKSDWFDDFTKREIKVVSLDRGDVSVVNQGASASTSASMRSAAMRAAAHLPTSHAAAQTQRVALLRLRGR